MFVKKAQDSVLDDGLLLFDWNIAIEFTHKQKMMPFVNGYMRDGILTTANNIFVQPKSTRIFRYIGVKVIDPRTAEQLA